MQQKDKWMFLLSPHHYNTAANTLAIGVELTINCSIGVAVVNTGSFAQLNTSAHVSTGSIAGSCSGRKQNKQYLLQVCCVAY